MSCSTANRRWASSIQNVRLKPSSRLACQRAVIVPRPQCAPSRIGHATSSQVTDEDRAYMRQALELASRALGQTYPNPAVGCVLVKNGKVVGQGYHPKAGMPHAEVYALRGAGNEAEGCTAYVTLEPCAHYGRTPPCSRALVDAKVAKVVIGVGDPNPLVAAQGIAILEDAGIEVVMMDGEESRKAYELNRDFMMRMEKAALTPLQTST